MVTIPFVEEDLADALEEAIVSLTSTNLKVGAFTDPNESGDPVKQACLYNTGGATEKQFNFRVMTRADDYTEAMQLANEIYAFLNRLARQDLVTIHVYYITGQRPQQSGRDESGLFYSSAEYEMSFDYL